MRHGRAHRKLGRVADHRIAMLRNQAEALLRHERIQTTVPKAKELRPFVERIITIAKRSLADGGETRGVTARRLVGRDIQDRTIIGKLFETIAPRFAGRPGGYTRLLRLGYRRGDSAEVAQVELIGSEYDPSAATDKTKTAEAAPVKSKGVGGRLRAAAERLRGKKDEPAQGRSGKAEGGSKAEVKSAKAEAKRAAQAKKGGRRKTGE
jgi:large subunit ribosomal protein L17